MGEPGDAFEYLRRFQGLVGSLLRDEGIPLERKGDLLRWIASGAQIELLKLQAPELFPPQPKGPSHE